ncbi:MAG: hypothetical protein HRT44_06040 [Bdellovibrionales bacterium]|nr:hypothetical protein [Bdellovibrionales bacterium]NQZ18803.1 hypothetical protein [Bdellovibrionales bacterium]
MTTDLVLLFGLFVFILGGAFLGDKGPRNVFKDAAPRLGARVEGQISIGNRFPFRDGKAIRWVRPNGAAPLGTP